MFISKKMREINTSESPNISLDNIPPQRANKNIFSDFSIENLIINRPIKKFKIDTMKPNKIDLKNNMFIVEKMKRIIIRDMSKNVIVVTPTSNCFSFFTISGFQNRFDESIHASKNTKKCKNNS